MARVNHKKVKQMLDQNRSKITDRQFFTSRILAGHYEDMAIAQTRRYKYNRRIHMKLIWKPRSDETAVTNNRHILINAGHPLVTKKNRTREDRYEIVTGMFAHELGHVLFTDFPIQQTHNNFMGMYKWYPEPPSLLFPDDAKREKALWEYAKKEPRNLEMLQSVSHYVCNIIEDGYVESRMLSRFPGVLGQNLATLRDQMFEDMRTVTQLIESEEDEERPTHIFQSIAQLLLSYVKYGEIKYGEASKKDERIQLVFSLISDLDNAIMVTSGKERLKTVNLVLVRCWDYIESFIEVCKQRQDDAKAAGEETSVSETLAKAFGSVVGGSCAGEGDTIPVPEPRTSSCPACNAGKRKATKAIAEGSDEEDNSSSSESENAVSDEKEDDASDNSENSTTASQSSIGDDGVESGALSGNGKKNVSSEEEGRIPYQQTESVSEPTGGETSYNDDYQREHYENAASDIERLLDKMAEKAACEQLENERLRELNEAAQNISYGDIHAGVQIRVNRIADVDNELIEQYDQISAPLIRISKQLQKSIVQQLKDRQRGGKQTGLVMGRRLDAHALCRNDGKVFYKNALPNEVPQISVGLLLDESGSMSSCDRCTYARAAAIILYDFCHSLGIPVTIYGHTTGYDSVELFSYAEFQDIDQDDKYRLMDISARGSNRDGAALRFVAEKMVKRPEEIRILMLISDGQPADSGYYGAAAEGDLRGIKQEYRRKGLLFIAAAIGDDKQNIERIYGDSFMDITDLNQLPIKLTAVVKRHIGV